MTDPSEAMVLNSSNRQDAAGGVRALMLRDIHAQVGGELSGDGGVRISGINGIEAAGPGELTFADSAAYADRVGKSRASAVIVPADFPAAPGPILLRVANPRLAFLKAMYLFQPAVARAGGVHRRAVVAPDAELGEGVTIRECAVIRARAKIGRGSVIESGAHIGEGASVGENCFVGPNAVIMHGCRLGDRVILHGGVVIGADGFGFVWDETRYLKVPQLGSVIIEDDVELGANVCVDRATFGSTVVRQGTKVDNLVQIAHNDVIGRHVTISGQVGLAGSVQVGDRVVFGGQAGVADHVTIGDDVKIGAQSGVFKNVRAGETVWGMPARNIHKVKRELAALALLPNLIKRLGGTRPASRPRSRKP